MDFEIYPFRQHLKLDAGDKLTLNCLDYKTRSRTGLKWIKDGKSIVTGLSGVNAPSPVSFAGDDFVLIPSLDEASIDSQGYKLTYQNVTWMHAGTYTCQISGSTGITSRK